MLTLNFSGANACRVLILFAAIVTFSVNSDINAHSGASGVVKERMEAIKSMGAAMKTIGAMDLGKEKYDAEKARKAARRIGTHAGEVVALFPDTKDNHNPEVSEAAPAIWGKSDEFSALALKLANSSEQFAQNADKSDNQQVLKDFKAVGVTCKACHERFRIKKD
jgi:cytochrome c556